MTLFKTLFPWSLGIVLLVSSAACKKDSTAPTAAVPPAPPADTATFTHSPTNTLSPTTSPTPTLTATATFTRTPICTVSPVATLAAAPEGSLYCNPYEMDLGAVGVQKAVTSSISSTSDQDSFRFTTGIAGTYTFMLDCYTGTASIAYLWLYSDACVQMVSSFGTGAPFAITQALDAGTAYRIMVSAQSDGTLSQYRLMILPPVLPACSTPVVTPTPEAGDVSNICLTPVVLGTLTTGEWYLTGTMGYSGDNDYYALTAGATGTYSMIMDCLADTTTNLNVYNDTCDTAVASATGTTVKTLTFPAVSGTTYKIHVNISGAPAGGGGYALKVMAP